MKKLIILLLVSQAWAGNPVKKSDLNPTLEGPVIPGTKVPVEELNTAPTSPQLEEEHEEFRNTLRARKEKQKEMMKKMQIKRKSHENPNEDD